MSEPKPRAKFAPRTPPTGYVPSGGVARPAGVPPAAAAPGIDLEEAALRVCYVRERSRWETLQAGQDVLYRPPRSYDGTAGKTIEGEAVLEKPRASVWKSLLRWFREKGIPPQAYVQVQFDFLPTTVLRPPEPPQLKSDVCLQRWRQGEPKIGARIATALRVQRNLAQQSVAVELSYDGTSHDEACAYTCVRGDLDLSPLFRYCFALGVRTPRLNQIAANWESEAVLQFQSHRAHYVSLWRNVLPSWFPGRADRMYPRYLAEHLGRIETSQI